MLEVENSELAERLETRRLVERAKGILQRDLGITEEETYRLLAVSMNAGNERTKVSRYDG